MRIRVIVHADELYGTMMALQSQELNVLLKNLYKYRLKVIENRRGVIMKPLSSSSSCRTHQEAFMAPDLNDVYPVAGHHMERQENQRSPDGRIVTEEQFG